MGTTAALDRPSIRESALLRSTSGLPVIRPQTAASANVIPTLRSYL